jgi:hypothetical protein
MARSRTTKRQHRRGYEMSFVVHLFDRPHDLSVASRYTATNGVIYLVLGAALLIFPQMVQVVFRDAPFVGNEGSLVRVLSMALMVIGWMYLFGGLAGSRRLVVATVIERLTLVPLVLVPLAAGGVFPHFLLATVALDAVLGIGAWILLSRS